MCAGLVYFNLYFLLQIAVAEEIYIVLFYTFNAANMSPDGIYQSTACLTDCLLSHRAACRVRL